MRVPQQTVTWIKPEEYVALGTAQPSQSGSVRLECLGLSLALGQMFEGLD